MIPSHRKANTPPIKQLSHGGNTARGTCAGNLGYFVFGEVRAVLILRSREAASRRMAQVRKVWGHMVRLAMRSIVQRRRYAPPHHEELMVASLSVSAG
jgi:hypothetical protein